MPAKLPQSKKIDKNLIRTNGLISLIMLIAGLFISSVFWYLLAVDIVLRIYKEKYSPICYLSQLIINAAKAKPNLTPKAPKVISLIVELILVVGLLIANISHNFFIYELSLLGLSLLLLIKVLFNCCVVSKIYMFVRKSPEVTNKKG